MLRPAAERGEQPAAAAAAERGDASARRHTRAPPAGAEVRERRALPGAGLLVRPRGGPARPVRRGAGPKGSGGPEPPGSGCAAAAEALGGPEGQSSASGPAAVRRV